MDAHTSTDYAPARTPLLRVNEVAALLAIGRRTVYTLVHAGELPAVRVGERLRFRPEEIDAYLDARREEPAP
jgi:excisionase family DNA binding protein